MKKPDRGRWSIEYKPEEWGVEILEHLTDPHACYDFQDFLIGVDIETGDVFYVEDQGCSCPAPFENVQGPDDVSWVRTLSDYRQFQKDLETYNKGYYSDETETKYDPVRIAKIERLVKEAAFIDGTKAEERT